MSPRTLVFIIVLSLAVIGSWYLAQTNESEETTTTAYESKHRGYYLKQARILGTAEDGSMLYEIEAEHAEQTEERRIDFTDVRVRYSPESDVPWIVSADAATLMEGSPQIALRGHVVALNRGDSESQETEIRTEYLELDPERYIAETDQRVQVRIGARSLTATGMLASLNDNHFELKANVRGKIAP